MINAQFDLQNTINEMSTVDRAPNSSSNSDKGQFSETLDRISRSESSKRRSTSTHQPYEKAEQRPSEKPISDSRDEADSSEPEDGPGTATTQSVVSQSSGMVSLSSGTLARQCRLTPGCSGQIYSEPIYCLSI